MVRAVRGGRAGNFYRGPRLNGSPEELDYGARNRQSMKKPYNFYRGPLHSLYGPAYGSL